MLSTGKWGVEGCVKFCAAKGLKDFSRIMVSVPKRHFKRAVKRNLLKRRMREAYRLNKNLIKGGPADILFFYNETELCDFDKICTDIKAVLESL